MEIKSAIAADEPAFRNRPLSLAGRVIRGPSRVIQKAARPLKLAGSNDIISQENCIMFFNPTPGEKAILLVPFNGFIGQGHGKINHTHSFGLFLTGFRGGHYNH